MAKYIDADELKESLKKHYTDITVPVITAEGGLESYFRRSEIKNTIKLIDSLQQEQPEESIVKEAIQLVFEEKLTPFKDGNQWSFLLGPNIQEGVCGFGDTILDAAIDFYKDYSTTRIHIGELKKTMEQPEVDLDEEVQRWKNKHGVVGMDDLWLKFAHHFYELKLNIRKEE